MSSLVTHSELTVEESDFTKLMELSGISGFYEDMYLRITEDGIEAVQEYPNQSVRTYNTFNESYFESINIETDEGYSEVMLNIESTLNYFALASDGKVDITFRGAEDSTMAKQMAMSGALNTRVMLPGSESTLEQVPIAYDDSNTVALPDQWDEDNQYWDEEKEKTLPTVVDTTIGTVQRVIDAVSQDDDVDYYPFVVEDDEFRLDIGGDSGNAVWGALPANSVEGPGADAGYWKGFEEVFGILSGNVTLMGAPPEESPLAVLKVNNDHTVRHVLGSV